MDTRFVWGRGRHATEEERARTLRVYEKSGLTQREFTARYGMQLSTLGRWLRAGRRDTRRDRAPANAVEFHSVELPATGSWAVEVQKGDGTTIRLDQRCPAELAQTVLKAIR